VGGVGVVLFIGLVILAAVTQEQERTDETSRLAVLEQQIADSARAGRFTSALLLLEQLAPIPNAMSNVQELEKLQVEYAGKRESLRNLIVGLQAKYEADSLAGLTAQALAALGQDSSASGESTSGWQDTRDPFALMEAYMTAYRKADTTELAAFYGEQVKYFDRGMVGREYVLKDKAAYFARWPSIQIASDSTIPASEQLQISESVAGTFEMTWRVLFTVSGRGETLSGKAVNRLVMAPKPGAGMVIVAETSSVTERFD
jgi:hypothetical protein